MSLLTIESTAKFRKSLTAPVLRVPAANRPSSALQVLTGEKGSMGILEQLKLLIRVKSCMKQCLINDRLLLLLDESPRRIGVVNLENFVKSTVSNTTTLMGSSKNPVKSR